MAMNAIVVIFLTMILHLRRSRWIKNDAFGNVGILAIAEAYGIFEFFGFACESCLVLSCVFINLKN